MWSTTRSRGWSAGLSPAAVPLPPPHRRKQSLRLYHRRHRPHRHGPQWVRSLRLRLHRCRPLRRHRSHRWHRHWRQRSVRLHPLHWLRRPNDAAKLPLLSRPAPGPQAGNDMASQPLPSMWQGGCHGGPRGRRRGRGQARLVRQDYDVDWWPWVWDACSVRRPAGRRAFADARSCHRQARAAGVSGVAVGCGSRGCQACGSPSSSTSPAGCFSGRCQPERSFSGPRSSQRRGCRASHRDLGVRNGPNRCPTASRASRRGGTPRTGRVRRERSGPRFCGCGSKHVVR